MAQWSTKRAEYEAQQKLLRAAQHSAAHKARIAAAIKLLVANDWQVKSVEPDAWDCKMPGSASTIVRGIEALERKTIGMR